MNLKYFSYSKFDKLQQVIENGNFKGKYKDKKGKLFQVVEVREDSKVVVVDEL